MIDYFHIIDPITSYTMFRNMMMFGLLAITGLAMGETPDYDVSKICTTRLLFVLNILLQIALHCIADGACLPIFKVCDRSTYEHFGTCVFLVCSNLSGGISLILSVFRTRSGLLLSFSSLSRSAPLLLSSSAAAAPAAEILS